MLNLGGSREQGLVLVENHCQLVLVADEAL